MTKAILVSLGAALVLWAVSLGLLIEVIANEQIIAQDEAERFDAYALADELRQTSDDLTRMARLYSATGDARYRDYFQEILDIRSGQAPRPLDYSDVYWDFVIATGQRPSLTDRPVALRTLMEDAGYSDAELALLQLSEDNSNRLAQVEVEALAATTPGELEAARATLHGQAYHEAKAQIMEPLNALLISVRTRTEADLQKRTDRLSALTPALYATLSISAALTLAGLFLAMRRPRTNS